MAFDIWFEKKSTYRPVEVEMSQIKSESLLKIWGDIRRIRNDIKMHRHCCALVGVLRQKIKIVAMWRGDRVVTDRSTSRIGKTLGRSFQEESSVDPFADDDKSHGSFSCQLANSDHIFNRRLVDEKMVRSFINTFFLNIFFSLCSLNFSFQDSLNISSANTVSVNDDLLRNGVVVFTIILPEMNLRNVHQAMRLDAFLIWHQNLPQSTSNKSSEVRGNFLVALVNASSGIISRPTIVDSCD